MTEFVVCSFVLTGFGIKVWILDQVSLQILGKFSFFLTREGFGWSQVLQGLHFII